MRMEPLAQIQETEPLTSVELGTMDAANLTWVTQIMPFNSTRFFIVSVRGSLMNRYFDRTNGIFNIPHPHILATQSDIALFPVPMRNERACEGLLRGETIRSMFVCSEEYWMHLPDPKCVGFKAVGYVTVAADTEPGHNTHRAFPWTRSSLQDDNNYYAMAHSILPTTSLPTNEAALHVHWHRMIIDEVHLFASNNTNKRRMLSLIEADSVLALTAERNFTVDSSLTWFHNPRFNTRNSAKPLDSHLRLMNTVVSGRVDLGLEVKIHEPVLVRIDPLEAIRQEIRTLLTGHFGTHTPDQIFSVLYLNMAHLYRQLERSIVFTDTLPSREMVVVAVQRAVDMTRAMMGEIYRREQQQQQHHRGAPRNGGNGTATAIDLSEQSGVRVDTLSGLQCPICFEEQANDELQDSGQWVVIDPCRHTLCRDCLDDMRQRNRLLRTCAMCRGVISKFLCVIAAAGAGAGQAMAAGAGAGAGEAMAAGAGAGAGEAMVGVAAGAGAGAAADAGVITFGSKMERVLTLLHEITEEAEGDRYGAFRGAVIYCDASDVQTERLAQAIRASGLGVSVYTMLSKHSMARRTTILDEVNQSAVAAAAVVENGSERGALPPVLLVRYRMAAVGLNFVFANHVILFQMPHRVDYLHQAVGRLVRLGQRSSKIHAWSILITDSFEHHTYRAWKYSMTTPPNGHSTNLLSSLAQSYIFPRAQAVAMDEEQEEEEEEQES